MTTQLGKLEPEDLRSIWPDEATDFTTWLAEEQSLGLLGEQLGMELELVGTEIEVGRYAADIVCLDTADGSHVLIENQLETTNHSHLGQILTYAAGFERSNTLVWIARKFTDEHRAAVDMLNRISSTEFRFFAIEIELWRIGNSNPAPRFNIVGEPNDWTKGDAQQRVELTPAKRFQLEFWHGLIDYVNMQGANVRLQKPRAQHWMNLSIGRTGFNLAVIVLTTDNELRVEFVITHKEFSKRYFALLEVNKAAIDSEIGDRTTWENRDVNITCKIFVKKSTDLNDDADRDNQYAWIVEHLNIFKNVFERRIRELPNDRDGMFDEIRAAP